jgi:hypothetical protein
MLLTRDEAREPARVDERKGEMVSSARSQTEVSVVKLTLI